VTALVDSATCGSKHAHGRIHVVPSDISGQAWGLFDPREWLGQLRLAREVYRRAAHGRAIVHCGRAQPEGISALVAGLLRGGPPYIFWAHGEDVAVGLSSRHYAATMRLVYRHASAIIANSRNTARLIADAACHRARIHVVYPGVDGHRFRPDADDGSLRHRFARDGELLLLSVGRLQPRKGHALVIKALPTLIEQCPAIQYVIVGEGPEREHLERLAIDLQIARRVHFAGEVSDELLSGYFAACDVFVLPTRVEAADFEGFGIVFLEAAAAAKPAIGGRNGGVPEAIVEGNTGLLVSGEDEAELAAALRTLCLSETLRRRMGDTGRARALSEFTWERAAAAVSAIHCDLTGRAAASPAA
jgi:phosphatidylinositol alpha-1,6-mannosyltransferase